MLYRDGDKFKLMPYKATYQQHGEEHESYVVDKSEIQAFEEMGHIENLTIVDAEYSNEQQARLAEVENYPESDFQCVSAYVLDGEITEGSTLQSIKQKETLELSILELSEMMMGVMF